MFQTLLHKLKYVCWDWHILKSTIALSGRSPESKTLLTIMICDSRYFLFLPKLLLPAASPYTLVWFAECSIFCNFSLGLSVSDMPIALMHRLSCNSVTPRPLKSIIMDQVVTCRWWHSCSIVTPGWSCTPLHPGHHTEGYSSPAGCPSRAYLSHWGQRISACPSALRWRRTRSASCAPEALPAGCSTALGIPVRRSKIHIMSHQRVRETGFFCIQWKPW